MTETERDEVLARLAVSRETSERLKILSALLRKWTPRINLVARSSVDALWTRHIEDSAQLYRLAPSSARSWIDLGSGAGFPGLVIAALAAGSNPDMVTTLVESDARKCAFLATAAREMGVDVAIRNTRVERLPPAVHDVISARAVAPLGRLLDLSEHLADPGTVRLFPKGAGVASELTEVARAWHIRYRSHPSVTDPEAVILEIQEVSRGSVLRS